MIAIETKTYQPSSIMRWDSGIFSGKNVAVSKSLALSFHPVVMDDHDD